MDQPQKGRSSKQSKVKQKPEMEMMGNLAKSIVEVSKEESLKIEDPFDSYAYELKMRVYKDVKIFRSRFIQGYETLLEHLRSQSKPEKS